MDLRIEKAYGKSIKPKDTGYLKKVNKFDKLSTRTKKKNVRKHKLPMLGMKEWIILSHGC